MRASNGPSPAPSMAGSAFTPLHQRKFTPHSYFSNTLRDVIASNTNLVVILPQQNTEMQLRKLMFKAYKDQNIRSLKEYEHRLKELVDEECHFVDVHVNDFIGKRYVFLKSEVTSGVVKVDDAIPLDFKMLQLLRKPFQLPMSMEPNGKEVKDINGATETAMNNTTGTGSPGKKQGSPKKSPPKSRSPTKSPRPAMDVDG